ncbi:type II secretion system secretin GspD [Thioflexithrix psekupsensis]|uniref:Type II secretion system protein GspD n=1 Tax=Thioflexithrix psekupsensis TaxID=1570016 RepID=A0A251X7H3_9GAMM|nr:type II secretion system secretin GspD [Thioflexithrix psekupsensis]OUD13139.1 type II secretion system protein GspD [Thioflexithrix psekupsensis]
MQRILILLSIGLLLLSSEAMAQKVTLNFKGMDINLLIDTVSEVTNKTFIVDPRVKATVTVVSSNPMDSEEVYEVFLSILSVHGFSAIDTGTAIKIIPDSLAKSENTPVLNGHPVRGAELVTQIIKVNHVSAAQLIPLLRPLVPQQGHLVAYPPNNTLIISDIADNVNRIMRIVQRIDQAEDRDIDVMVLDHAAATEVVRILTTLEQQSSAAAAASSGGTPPSQATLIADERTNSILISGDRNARLRMKTLISHLDTPLKSVGNTKVVFLRYAQAAKLVDILKGTTDSLLSQQTDGTNSPDNTTTQIQADETTNSLIITAAPDILKNLESVIRQLDVRRAQVLVEAIIADITTDMSRELGIQWILDGSSNNTIPIGATNFSNAGNSIIDLAGAAYQINRGSGGSIPTLSPGAFLGLGRFTGNTVNFGVLLRALASDTNANILSTPSLLTLDNQEAEIKVGQNVPFITGQYTSTGAATGTTNPFQTIQREDVGIKLKVTPQINEGNAVKLDIEQEVSSLTRSAIATADVVINKRTIKTSVIIEDGNMIVLGGLIDEDLQQNSQKVPGLGDLPVVGHLFRSESTKKVKRNLMVFLRPVILRDAATEMAVSSEKYNYMRAKQLDQREQGAALLPASEVPVMSELSDFLRVLPGHAPIRPAAMNEPMPVFEAVD